MKTSIPVKTIKEWKIFYTASEETMEDFGASWTISGYSDVAPGEERRRTPGWKKLSVYIASVTIPPSRTSIVVVSMIH